MKLEVAEACSGIRSLVSLFTFAVFCGYFLEKTFLRRLVLALASVPIAIVANAVRIFGTGLCVQYWDPDKAQGFFHEFSGWVVFLVSLGCLLVVHRIMQLFPGTQEARMMGSRFWTVAVLLASTAGVLGLRSDTELVPASEPLPHMPRLIAEWSGTDVLIDQQTLDVLGKGEFLSRVYMRANESHLIGLFIGYFPSQRTDVTIHSPKNCLPGDGWALNPRATSI